MNIEFGARELALRPRKLHVLDEPHYLRADDVGAQCCGHHAVRQAGHAVQVPDARLSNKMNSCIVVINIEV